ncbi:unnamed protein product [Cuscuta epithymum]|uniref:Receptor-like serine/threonine-protein kinase n=1 Tax=Cuscuta epithymum TaxID=186058 RepID=A0AAV0C9F8_9ASTE|nr:unnamed protein product [Cuscuta epithymum]
MLIRNYSPALVSSFIFLCSYLTAHGADTIHANQTLSGDQTIVSSYFELGFFKPGNASKYYIGIWYRNIVPQTVVWVANRETAISDKISAELKMVDGNLVLLNELKITLWNTSLSSAVASNSISAVLLDSGNLVLTGGSDSGPNSTAATPLWQSFDYPTHTWLPGGKIAYDKRTKQKHLLISWRNSEDPAPGLYSLELDPIQKQYLIRWNRTEQYWTSGPWNNHIFSLVPEMRSNYIYNFNYIDNADESYFTYSLNVPSSLLSRFVMDISGQIKQLTWLETSKEWNLFWSQPRKQCEVHAYCGPFSSCQNSLPFCDCLDGFQKTSDRDWSLDDYSGGCTRKMELQCGGKDKFKSLPQMKPPDNPQSLSVGNGSHCESLCLGNCSCTAYAYDVSNGCSVWFGQLNNMENVTQDSGGGTTVNIRLSASEFPSAKSKAATIWIGATVGSVVFMLVLFGVIFFIFWKRRRHLIRTSKAMEGSLVAFSYRDLQYSTKNFSEKLGSGSFGSVYKGTLPDSLSSVIAVKKLEGISQGEKQFRTEVSTIGAVQHLNIVRLRGFCSEGNKKLLVYDYIPNGSLDSCLFGVEEGPKFLDWKSRYHIALGIARGLSYLHEKCRDYIIHCDIKPENILLDSEMCPKVADFGMAKLVGRDFSRVLTTMRGTRGYLAPEWITGVAITPKADVYSYGMVLFELLSGTRNSDHSRDGKVKFFPCCAARVILEGGDVLCLVDPKLDRVADPEEVSRICSVAFWCIQDDENQRPSMGAVVQILEGVLDVKMPPVPRSLQVFADDDSVGQPIVYFTESLSSGQSQSSLQTHTEASTNAFFSQPKNGTSST